MPNRRARRAAILTALFAGWALPAAADCYDILGCTDRDRFDRRFDYLASRKDGPNCQFLREMRFGILAGHDACADFAEDAAGPDACRAVDPDRVALSPVERANVATIRRAEALKGCRPVIGWEGLSDAPYPILGTRARMMEAVADFRAWAEAEPERQSREGWEYGYEFWPVLTAIFCRFLDASDPRAWDGPLVGTLLYILARDNAQCVLRKELSVRPGHLTALARAGTTSTEIEARWQLAAALAEAEIQDGEIHADEALGLLRTYAVDTDAYVRRMALLALARRRAPDTEALARRAWISGDEWERIGALHALEAVGSPQLPSYLAVAEREGGEFLRAHAREIAGRQDGVAPPPGMA